LDAGKARAGQLLELGQIDAALAILEPLAVEYPHDPGVHMMLGMSYFDMGNLDAALVHYERAYALDKEPLTLLPLGLAYFELAMYGSALHAFEESRRRGLELPGEVQAVLEQLRQDVGAVAGETGLPLQKAIAGLREMERGTRSLDRGDYACAIEANRAAIRVLGAWPAPHNNLALALFFEGQVAAAIAECRQVLARAPDNIIAACNLVQFLAWSSERGAAQETWQALRTRIPSYLPTDALRLAEAAAVMDDDESIRRLLLPLAKWSPEAIGDWRHYVQVQQFLATADANLGDPKAAKRRLRALDDDDPRVEALRTALRQGKPGLGFNSRFAYFHSHELVPSKVATEFAALVAATDDGNNPQPVKALKAFVARYPQLVVMAEKAIWEEDAVDFGLIVLRYVATPAAHAALRRFAGSQAGSDEQRTTALLHLQASGGAQPGEVFRVWRKGEWHELLLRSFTIGSRDDRTHHKAQVAKLMEQGQSAMHAGQSAEAAALFRQALAVEPRAYQALNNLAAALDSAGDTEGSRSALEQALAINPLYVFARVNLALKLVDQDLAAADAYLAPLETVTSFTPEEFVLYQYGLARVAMARAEYDAARSLLDMALSVVPDYAPATQLLERLDRIELGKRLSGAVGELHEYLAAKDAKYRRRQQARLATLAPSVADVVGVFSAEIQRAMAKAIAPAQRVTGLRKAELQQLVIATLLELATVEFIVSQQLSDTECAALTAVLDAGGAMPQEQFRQAYGDDAAESPSWQYQPPESIAGRLRLHGCLAETTVDGAVYLAIPTELRGRLQTALHSRLGGMRAAHDA
jgi:tetratricopeptide (TPR) repeat protein